VSTRLRARSLLLVPAFLAAVAAHPGLARATGVDFWNLSQVRAELAATVAHNQALAARDDTILRRLTIKEDLIAELIAGRANLADVTARFREMNADEPAYQEVMRALVPGDTDLERSARNVIDYATPRVTDPAARAALSRRVVAEFARLRDAGPPAVH
jgi:hypothetical protein